MRFVSLAIVAAISIVLSTAKTFEYVGVNEAGPEFGEKNFPGLKDKDYVWPKLDTIDTFMAKGMNTFRINILMERLVPKNLNGPMDEVYFRDLKTTVDHITSKGAWAMIVPHNYGRYYNKIINDVPSFEAWWKTVAAGFKDDSRVIFDINNEFHDMDQSLVVQLNQAAINGIRSAGAMLQPITVEGNSWSGAWTWVTKSQNGATMAALTDPTNKPLLYQMHQYLDSDGSGTHAECVNATIGAERLRDATAWLKQHKKIAILGEFAGGESEQCKTAVRGMLQHLKDNSDVWKGWLWWSAGPWWGSYMFNLEPESGKAYKTYFDLIMQYA